MTLVTTSARFRQASESGDLLGRIGAISGLAGTRYWSTTHKQWRTLITEAHAVNSAQSGERRPDFRSDEMRAGDDLYFEQTDNLAGKAVYRMRMIEVSPARIVFGISNLATMRYLLVPVFHPDELQSIYFLDRESENVWRFYGMVRTGKDANGLISRNETSAINRAVAFYRHLVGIPTDQEPPASR
jgi:hypothetical protein